jgi:hypothetical protein
MRNGASAYGTGGSLPAAGSLMLGSRARAIRWALQQFECAQQLQAVMAEPEQALPFVLPGIAG